MPVKKSTNTFPDYNVEYKTVNIKSRILAFSLLYLRLSTFWRYSLIVMLSLIGGVLNSLLIKNTGVYLPGIGGIMTGVSRIAYSITNSLVIYNALYWSLIIVANIPLAILSWFTLGKKFTTLTMSFLLTTYLFGFLISLIPGIDNIFVFGRVFPKGTIAFVVQWDALHNRALILLVYSLTFSIINGLIYSMIYIAGGSTAGLDFVSFYLAKRKNINISSVLMTINLISLVIASVIGSYIANIVSKEPVQGINGSNHSIDLFLSPNLVFSAAGVFLQIMIVNILFPRNKMMKVSVNTTIGEKVCNEIIAKKYQHGFVKQNIIGGYSNSPKMIVDTICRYPEALFFIDIVSQADPNAFISFNPIKGIIGKFSVPKN